jgi:maltose alpha-D-glucosyltransferase/alpha-amylase
VGDAPFLSAAPGALALVLHAFLMEKACYELQYELNHRPGWAHIPLSGLAGLLDMPSAPEPA